MHCQSKIDSMTVLPHNEVVEYGNDFSLLFDCVLVAFCRISLHISLSVLPHFVATEFKEESLPHHV